MARIPQNRTPATPTNDEQRERVDRILRAAMEHGTAKGLERMQMMDVARDAGVAIATLYRYFPSKTALFLGVMRYRMEAVGPVKVSPPGTPAWEAVAMLLNGSGRSLLERPLLARAMMASNSTAVAESSGGSVNEIFQGLILREAEIGTPTPGQERLVRLVEQAWYGIITSALNGYITPVQAEQDTNLACQMLLSDLANA